MSGQVEPKTLRLLPMHEAESMCPSRSDAGTVVCQEATGRGVEDRQRERLPGPGQ